MWKMRLLSRLRKLKVSLVVKIAFSIDQRAPVAYYRSPLVYICKGDRFILTIVFNIY
jgi:hypothetical protein